MIHATVAQTAAQVAILQSMGCHCAQGFHSSAAVPAKLLQARAGLLFTAQPATVSV
ncbi:MAG: hypothetical protein ABW278_02910 [Steroidobacteraceae bacterium]